MKQIFLIVVGTLLAVSPILGDSGTERAQRLRIEILELHVQMLQKELELKDLAAGSGETRQPTPEPSSFMVNAHGMVLPGAARIPELPLTMATTVATSARETVPATVDTAPQMATTPEATTTTAAAAPPTKRTPSRWSASYQMLKPSTRVYFDTGKDDPGEFDLFKEGDIGISLEFLTISVDYQLIPDAVWVGGFVSGGISTAASNTTANVGNAATLLWSAGVSIGFKGLPVAIEAGIMQGISASEMLDGGANDDTAFFVGMSLDKIIQKTSFLGVNSQP